MLHRLSSTHNSLCSPVSPSSCQESLSIRPQHRTYRWPSSMEFQSAVSVRSHPAARRILPRHLSLPAADPSYSRMACISDNTNDPGGPSGPVVRITMQTSDTSFPGCARVAYMRKYFAMGCEAKQPARFPVPYCRRRPTRPCSQAVARIAHRKEQ